MKFKLEFSFIKQIYSLCW